MSAVSLTEYTLIINESQAESSTRLRKLSAIFVLT
jgi:hypothetical protein